MPFKHLLSKPLETFLAVALGVMLVLVFANVVLRYFFHTGISISEEVSRFLFVWLTFIGALLALRDNDHLGVDMLTRHLPAGGKFICKLLAHCLMLVCCIAFMIGSWRQALINMSTEMPVTGMPLGLMYAAGVICGVSMGGILIWRIIAMFRQGSQEKSS